MSSFYSLPFQKHTFFPTQSNHCFLKGIIDSDAGCNKPFILPRYLQRLSLIPYTYTFVATFFKETNLKLCSSWNCESFRRHSLGFFLIILFRNTFLAKLHLAKQQQQKNVFLFKIWKVLPCLPTCWRSVECSFISTDPGFLESLLLPGLSGVRSFFSTRCHEVVPAKTQFSQYFPLLGKKNIAICCNSLWNKGRQQEKGFPV